MEKDKPNEELTPALVVPSTQDSTQIKQHNILTEAYYNTTSLQKDIMYLLASKIKDGDDTDKKYIFDLSVLASYRNKGHLAYHNLSKALQRLESCIIFVRRSKLPENFFSSGKPPDDYDISADPQLVLANSRINAKEYQLLTVDIDGARHCGFKIVSLCKYLGRAKAAVQVTKFGRWMFSNLKDNFTVIDRETALSLKVNYAKRIYEVICQYHSTGLRRISVKELKRCIGVIIIDPKTGKEHDKYPKPSLFRSKVLEPAKQDLHRVGVNLQIKEYKSKEDQKEPMIEFTFPKGPKALAPKTKKTTKPHKLSAKEPGIYTTFLKAVKEQCPEQGLQDRLREIRPIKEQDGVLILGVSEEVYAWFKANNFDSKMINIATELGLSLTLTHGN